MYNMDYVIRTFGSTTLELHDIIDYAVTKCIILLTVLYNHIV